MPPQQKTWSITDWLTHESPPADIYDLLGLPLFHPDLDRMRRRIRRASRELLLYQNQDTLTAQRVSRLQRELGRASEALSSRERRQGYYEQVLHLLRREYAAEVATEDPGAWAREAIVRWLHRRRSIAPAEATGIAEQMIETADVILPEEDPDEIPWFLTDEDRAREVVDRYVSVGKPAWRRRLEPILLFGTPVVLMMAWVIYLYGHSGNTRSALDTDNPVVTQSERKPSSSPSDLEEVPREPQTQPQPVVLEPAPHEEQTAPAADVAESAGNAPLETGEGAGESVPTAETGRADSDGRLVRPPVPPPVTSPDVAPTGSTGTVWSQGSSGEWALNLGRPFTSDGRVVIGPYNYAAFRITETDYSDTRNLPYSSGESGWTDIVHMSVDDNVCVVALTGRFRGVVQTHLYTRDAGAQQFALELIEGSELIVVSPSGNELVLMSRTARRGNQWEVEVRPRGGNQRGRLALSRLQAQDAPLVVFGRTGRSLVVAGTDAKVFVYTYASTGRLLRAMLPEAPPQISRVAIDDTRGLVVAAGVEPRDDTLVLKTWDVESESLVASRSLEGWPELVHLSTIADGQCVVAVGTDRFQVLDSSTLRDVGPATISDEVIVEAAPVLGSHLLALVRGNPDPHVDLVLATSGRLVLTSKPEDFLADPLKQQPFQHWAFTGDGTRLLASVPNVVVNSRAFLLDRYGSAPGWMGADVCDLAPEEWLEGLEILAAAGKLNQRPRTTSSSTQDVSAELEAIRSDLLRRGEWTLLGFLEKDAGDDEALSREVQRTVSRLALIGVSKDRVQQAWPTLLEQGIPLLLEQAAASVEAGRYARAVHLFESVRALDESQLSAEHERLLESARSSATSIED